MNSTTLRRTLYVLLVACVACAFARAHAAAETLEFRPDGLVGLQQDRLLAWSKPGQLQLLDAHGSWRPACKLPLDEISQVVAHDSEIIAIGYRDATHRSALLTNTSCASLNQWQLGSVWTDVIMDAQGQWLTIGELGTAKLLSNGRIDQTIPFLRRAVARIAHMGAIHVFDSLSGRIVCHDKDVTKAGDAPAWCALQTPNGWQKFGDWDAALSCADTLLLRASTSAKLTRWTAYATRTGARVAQRMLPRGPVRCVDDRYLLSGDARLRLFDAASLQPRWDESASKNGVVALAATNSNFAYVADDDPRVRLVHRTRRAQPIPREAPLHTHP